jgi:prepilin peptidase CpaA
MTGSQTTEIDRMLETLEFTPSMSALRCAATIQSDAAPGPSSGERSALVAWSAALTLTLAVIAAGLRSGTPLLVLACTAAFLFVAVASDVRRFRVPNLLTLPALAAALLLSPWCGTSGPLEAALGAALGFVLLLGPYAAGGMGAGDVKALMALGAWLGPATTLGAAAWALIAAGSFGVALLALRGELGDFFGRWGRALLTTLTLRRFHYEAPARGSSAAGGIPFAAALALGLAAQWLGGSPW